MKKFVINQHRPAFFSGFENAKKYFNTLGELLNFNFVKNFTKSSVNSKFHRFSLSRSEYSDRIALMAEYNENDSWYVVGHIDPCNKDDRVELLNLLPEWIANEESIKRRNDAEEKKQLDTIAAFTPEEREHHDNQLEIEKRYDESFRGKL